MHLVIDGQPRHFTPIKTFCAENDLPPTFGVALFEPKDYTGLGRIDRAGNELNQVRRTVIDALPESLSVQGWLALVPQLQVLFRNQLVKINDAVGLREIEIDFAAAGFGDVCQAVVYTLLRAANQPVPPFADIYADWLNSTVRVSQTVHLYEHRGQQWRVQIVTHAYGRIGLVVYTDAATLYLADAVYSCPAEGFMAALLGEVAAHMVGQS